MSAVDPVTFEILRHRLWAINEEAATTIALVSGSPVVTDAFDFNSALMDATGRVVVIGPYIVAHAAALDTIVEYVIREFSDNPGIGPGDMFATNDPYVGAMHQPDLAVIAPIFDGDRLIMWCGSIVHHSDVGGPVAGSVTVGARSIYEEAIPLAPIRLVEGGRLRKDLEREYLIRSRLPQLNALDLRGQVAANNVETMRVLELCGRYGTETVLAVLDELVETTDRQLRRRLSELPDGRWRHVSFVEHDGTEDAVYAVECEMTKRGDRLDFDFGASSAQAPGLINSSIGTLRGYTLASLFALLGFDLPWIPAGYWGCVGLSTKRGTVVDAEWPAGVSMGNTSVGHAIRVCVNVCMSMMLDASEAHAGRVLASCMGSFAGQNISGTRSDGRRFGTMILDSIAGGGGARAFADGPDTAGMLQAPASAISNVETNEHNYPMLYMWRRQTPDSGGPGRFRGGAGGEHGYVPFGVGGEFECTLFAQGVEQPNSAGLSGGEPGGVNGFLIVRGGAETGVTSREGLQGEELVMPPKATTRVSEADAFVHWYAGGGGIGDPLDRDPEAVLRDVEDGLVTPEGARHDYLVGFDAAETEALRGAERRRRLGDREPLEPSVPLPGAVRAGDALVMAGGSYACSRCGTELAPVSGNFKDGAVLEEIPVGERHPRAGAHPGSARFVLRRYHCPGCARQLEVEVNLAGAPALWSMRLDV